MSLHEQATAIFLGSRTEIERVYGPERIAAVMSRMPCAMPGPVVEPSELAACRCNAEVVLSTWGMPVLSEAEIAERLPNAKAVLYAAGSVQLFARPWLARGASVVSAWRANAKCVAQFAVAQILLSMKGYARNVREYEGSPQSHRHAFRGKGSYGEAVCVLGAGAVGRQVIDLLRGFEMPVIYWDPMLGDGAAAQIDAERSPTLIGAIARGYVVTNHLADKPATKNLIDSTALSALRQDATFINTGRGATVDESALADLLGRRSDLTALLDVTAIEPMGADHPLRSLPNAVVSTHIAGAIGDEVRRLADLCIEELDRYLRGEPLRHAVSIESLETMA